jgi:hypothetical protein
MTKGHDATMSDSEFDDTAMTEEEFDHRFTSGVAVEVVSSPSLWVDGSAPYLSRGGQAHVIMLPPSTAMTATSVAGEDRAREAAVLTR